MAKAKVYDFCVVGHSYNTDEAEGTNWVTLGTCFPTKDGTGLNGELDVQIPVTARKVMINPDGTTETRMVPVRFTIKPRTAANASTKKKVAPKKKAVANEVEDVPF